MKIVRPDSGNKKGEKPKAVAKVVRLAEFILDDSGKAIGITGVSYPDKAPMSITLTSEGAKAENAKRKDFEAYRKGFMAFGRKVMLEPGAILRLNCVEKGGNAFETDWINNMAHSQEESAKAIRFGFTGVELFTPDTVKEKYRAVAAKLQSENPEASRYDISAALLARLTEEKDQVRYRGNVLQYHPDKIMESDHAALRDVLARYYGDAKFEKVAAESGDKLYAPVSPGMVIRALNTEGDVVAAMNVTSNMLYHAKAETPEDRAAYAFSLVEQTFPGEEVASYSLLPYDKSRISDLSMTVEDKTIPGIRAFERAQQLSFKKVAGEDGESGYENFGVQAAVKRADNGMITEIAIPHGAQVVDVALLAKDGTRLREAVRQDQEESNGPGM